MEIYPIHIENFKIDGGVMFGVVPKVLWKKVYPADDENLCNWALRSLLVVDGNRKILIDNGFGDKQSAKFFSHFHLNGGKGLKGALAEYGYKPEDITDMVLTHLHYDHCGGGLRYNSGRTALELVFPNATYWISRSQWNWAINPNKREADSFLSENLLYMQESGHLKFIEENGMLFPGFEVRIYDGHTKGQVVPFIHFKDKTIVFVADLLPSVAHIPLPYIASYDVEPMKTLKEKEDFLNEAFENNYVLFFEHDLYNECCNLKCEPKGIKAKDVFLLKDFLSGAGKV